MNGSRLSAADLLRLLAERGIHVEAVGDRLRWHGPTGAMTDDLREDLRQRKAEVLRLLAEAARDDKAPRSVTLADLARAMDSVARLYSAGERVTAAAVAKLASLTPEQAAAAMAEVDVPEGDRAAMPDGTRPAFENIRTALAGVRLHHWGAGPWNEPRPPACWMCAGRSWRRGPNGWRCARCQPAEEATRHA